MARPVRGSVAVISGASSGIGRAAALEFAARGATGLVLAARRSEALREVAHDCRVLGARALPLRTDVADEDQVRRLARQAVAEFGRLDVWVNNAGVTSFGSFQDTPPEVFRRVFETNLFGYVYGARAALEQFLRQRSGILINNASILATLSHPFVSGYVASKHAIRGLGRSLRQELALQGLADVHVCTVMPASVDTPLLEHAANFTGRTARATRPLSRPERVAHAITDLVETPRREVFVGTGARLLALLSAMAPGAVERVAEAFTARAQFDPRVPSAAVTGSVFEPMRGAAACSGGRKSEGRSLLRAAALGAAAIGSALVGALSSRAGEAAASPPRPVRREPLLRVIEPVDFDEADGAGAESPPP